jgi:hypothetical protein
MSRQNARTILRERVSTANQSQRRPQATIAFECRPQSEWCTNAADGDDAADATSWCTCRPVLSFHKLTPNVANHAKNFWCGVHGFQADLRMRIMKDPKDFICKSLPNHFYAREIKHSNLELADPREHSFRL